MHDEAEAAGGGRENAAAGAAGSGAELAQLCSWNASAAFHERHTPEQSYGIVLSLSLSCEPTTTYATNRATAHT